MTIRVGESWQARNGHRRWVSFPLHDLLALNAIGLVVIGPFWLLWKLFLAEAWLAAECGLILVTALLVAAALIRHEAKPGEVTLSRLRWGLRIVDLKGRHP